MSATLDLHRTVSPESLGGTGLATAAGLTAVGVAYLGLRRASLRLAAPAPIDEARPDAPGAVGRALAALALQDCLVLAYVGALTLVVAVGVGPRRREALGYLALDALFLVVTLAIARSELVSSKLVRALVYRVSLPATVAATFAQLHFILPAGRVTRYDAELYAIDLALFGFEPAEAWDRFVTPATTEWFSFFYYSYFAILLVHVAYMSFLERRGAVLREFSWGLFWVFCVGQLLYLVVPGYGPYAFLAPKLTHRLEGPVFWPLVASAVSEFDGPHRTDIFPSLHTAVPTFFTLFALRHRALAPFRYAWPVLAFFTVNIIIATMFLRWHYLLDICAGIALATTALLGARWLPSAEERERARAGVGPIYLPLEAPAEAGGPRPDFEGARGGR